MKNWLSLFIVLLLSLFQSTVLSINFLLIFVLWKGSYPWAFWTGLVLDLMAGNRLGLSSFLFLLLLFLFRLYSRKYEPRPFFLITFIFLASFIFAKIEAESWSFWQGIVLSLGMLLLREQFEKERQLKLDL